MKNSLCIDMIYVTRSEHGWVWATTEQLLEGMEIACRLGLAGVEFWNWEGRDLDALQTRQQALGLTVTAISSKHGDLLGDPTALDKVEHGFAESIPVAQRFGCKNLILNANCYPKQLPRAAVREAMAQGLRRIVPLAEQAGVTVLLEPLSGGFFQSSAEAFDLIDTTESCAVKLLYDLYHFQLIEGNLTNTLRTNLNKIGHIHGAGVPARGELTDGELNYPFLLRTLEELGYDGWFCMEFFTFDHREEKLAASCSILR